MKKKRIYKAFVRQAKKQAFCFDDAPDPRQQGKVRHKMSSIIHAVLLGQMAGYRTLRDIEEMTKGLAWWLRPMVPEPISDTTLHWELARMHEGYLEGKLTEQVRAAYRSKILKPEGFPCGVVTIDGKNLATLDHDACGRAQKRHVTSNTEQAEGNKTNTSTKANKTVKAKAKAKAKRKAKSKGKARAKAKAKAKGKAKQSNSSQATTSRVYYLAPVLRAVLVSAQSRPIIAQLALGPHEAETTAFGRMLRHLEQAYGRMGLYEIIDADAGFASLANADMTNEAGLGYVFALKDNQPELYAEAKRLLEPMAEAEPPDAETPWQRRNGKFIRRRLWRTAEMRGMETSAGCWAHLRQTWLVRQETRDKQGHVTVEDRYFLTSVLWNYLKPWQILLLVRRHWAIENDVFNSLDLQWKEDSGPMCTRGRGVWVLALLRAMAYNFVQYVRRRVLRRKDRWGRRGPVMPWRWVFQLMAQMLYTAQSQLEATAAGV